MKTKYESVVLNSDANMTSRERDLMMIKSLEEKFKTGPIIGDAYEVILQLSRNIQVRDVLLQMMGMPVGERERMFQIVNDAMDARDQTILDERKNKQ